MSAPRLSALSVVVFGGPLTLGQLAAAEQVKPPTMTRIVTGLEKEGLVQRLGDVNDRRLTQIQATVKGRTCLQRDERVESKGWRLLSGAWVPENWRSWRAVPSFFKRSSVDARRAVSDPRRERISAVERRHRRTK